MDGEEECFIFPAITKPYSQVTPASSPQRDCNITTAEIVSTPTPRPLYQPNNRQRYSRSHSLMLKGSMPREQPGSSYQSRYFLPVQPPPPFEETAPKRNLLKKSSLRTKLDNGSEVRRSVISIQDVRKYSVVDPSTLKFVQG